MAVALYKTPPGTDMQMLDPAIKFVQVGLRAGFQDSSCVKVIPLAVATPKQVSPGWTE